MTIRIESYIFFFAFAFLATLSASPPIVFQGNVHESDSTLERALRYYNVPLKGAFDITDADDAAFFLKEFYIHQGYPHAKVTYDYQPNPLSVVFHIDEGMRLWIGEVTFIGNKEVETNRLKDVFSASIRQSTNAPFGRLKFVPSALSASEEALQTMLVNDGFLDAEVAITNQQTEGNRVSLEIEINEGHQYSLTEIAFRGTSFSNQDLLDYLSIYFPKVYQPKDLFVYQEKLLGFFQNHGYLDAQVDGIEIKNSETGELQILFQVHEGRLYTLSEVELTGLQRTKASAVLRELNLPLDQPFDMGRIEKGLQRLWETGAFIEIEKNIDLSKDGKLRLLLNLEESRAKVVRFFLGYGQWEQALARVSYIDRNIFGSLNRLEVNADVSMKGYGADATLFDPTIFNMRLTGMLGGFMSRRELPAYESTQYGAFIGVSHRQNLQNLTGYQLQYLWYANTHSRVFGEEENDRNYTVGMLQFRQRFDRRNSMFTPMSGFLLQHEFGVATRFLLGDLSFLRGTGQATFYLPASKPHSERPLVPFFVLNSRVGWLLPFDGDKSVPVPERFFLGGPNSIRSFSYETFGPQDKGGTPVGGQAFLLQNIEFQVPVFRGLYLASFVDIANLAPRIDTISLEETAVGVGLGLRFYTPIGALQLDYGYNLIRRSGYPVGAWQFGFGLNF